MHMADALVSPAVGGTVWALSAATIVYASSQVKKSGNDRVVPLMGVLGAFVFAAQMINFTIPLTGSSGHLAGGMLLAALLGPAAAFLTISSVLVVQALFFADGGLLALGCNILNLGFIPAFLIYPLLYKPLAGDAPVRGRLVAASVISAVVALQLGALSVVLQTTLSGISSLPFTSFLLLMQPVHLAIGLIEGLVTATVLLFVLKARPELLKGASSNQPASALRPVLAGFMVAALFIGGLLSWFASSHPDGLEWSISRTTGADELHGPEQGLHGLLAGLQEKLAILPDYNFRKEESVSQSVESNAGTSLAGITGSLATLLIALGAGFVATRRKLPSESIDAGR